MSSQPRTKNALEIKSTFGQALGHFRRAVASEPENVEALFCKAVLSAQLMELFDALKVAFVAGVR